MGSKTVLLEGRYKVINTNHGYVVVNILEDYSHHSHFKTYKGATRCLLLIKKRILPKDSWWREALHRLLSEEDFLNLKSNDREIYYNVNNGVRKRK